MQASVFMVEISPFSLSEKTATLPTQAKTKKRVCMELKYMKSIANLAAEMANVKQGTVAC